jgi:uncharacterized glyoxalase superfamily protein PhnB
MTPTSRRTGCPFSAPRRAGASQNGRSEASRIRTQVSPEPPPSEHYAPMAEPNDGPSMFIGVHLAVADMAKAMNFYRRAGLPVPDGAEGREHVQIDVGEDVHLAFSTSRVIAMYDSEWRGPNPSTATVLQLQLSTRLAVDDMYAALTSAGYHGHLAPIDAFWGNRYCEVDDADGHTVGFQSPTDVSLRAPTVYE